MRLWMIDPKLLCTQHLLGEHLEIHKHRHVFIKHYSITGRIYPIVQIEPASMEFIELTLAESLMFLLVETIIRVFSIQTY